MKSFTKSILAIAMMSAPLSGFADIFVPGGDTIEEGADNSAITPAEGSADVAGTSTDIVSDAGEDFVGGEGDALLDGPLHIPFRHRHPGTIYKSRALRQFIAPGQVVGVRRVLGLDNRYCGLRVDEVTVQAEERTRFVGHLSLLVNGVPVDSQYFDGFGSFALRTPFGERLCNPINTLQIQNTGRTAVLIEGVGAYLSRR